MHFLRNKNCQFNNAQITNINVNSKIIDILTNKLKDVRFFNISV